jgi:hypothetical protein
VIAIKDLSEHSYLAVEENTPKSGQFHLVGVLHYTLAGDKALFKVCFQVEPAPRNSKILHWIIWIHHSGQICPKISVLLQRLFSNDHCCCPKGCLPQCQEKFHILSKYCKILFAGEASEEQQYKQDGVVLIAVTSCKE